MLNECPYSSKASIQWGAGLLEMLFNMTHKPSPGLAVIGMQC
jgi:hypothetical protein